AGFETHRRRAATGGGMVHRRLGDVVRPVAGGGRLDRRVVLLVRWRLAFRLGAFTAAGRLFRFGAGGGRGFVGTLVGGLGGIIGSSAPSPAFATGIAAGLDRRHQGALGDLVINGNLDLLD